MRWKVLVATLALSLAGCGDDLPAPAPAPVEPAVPPVVKDAEPPPAPPDPPPKAAPPPPAPAASTERQEEREAMVQRALVDWGVKDEAALRAMRRCPRHRFVPKGLQEHAYENRPLRIGEGQTISQPTIVGSMTEELHLTSESKVLEIGTGSGYQAAVLAEITPHVYSIEIKEPLAKRARETLTAAGYESVTTRLGDGYYGWPEQAPFDAIIVTAAAPHVPPPLVRQLKPGGRLVIPIGPPFARQDLVLVIKDAQGKVYTQSLYGVAFVPLTGSLGEKENLRAAVFLLSGALLAHEICLLRVLAIAFYSHAASLVVSVALLGFGAAATLLALVPRLKHPDAFAVAIALYAVLVPLSLRAGAAVDFNVLQVGWDSGEWLRLLVLQGVFFLPFLFGALAIAIALALHAARPGPIYGMNLLGSGVGAVAAVPLLTLGPPEAVLVGLALAAAASACFVRGRRPKILAVGAAACVLLLGAVGLPMSPFKDLPATPNHRVLETRHGPLGRVDLVESAAFHHADGLSMLSDVLPPAQQGLFVDGHFAAVKDLGPSTYLDRTAGGLPFALGLHRRVLLLGVGPDLARAGTVVEPNADLLALSGATGVVAEPRAFLENLAEPYDLIVLHVGKRDPVREAPLLTAEGLTRALACVSPDGAVAVSTTLTTPARPGLRLLLTAEGVTPHVVAVRSMKRLCVLLRHRSASPNELEALALFCEHNGFDIVRPLAARPESPIHRAATPLLRPGANYPYDVEPTSDARPYFHRFFRWSRLGDVFDPKATPFVEWPFVVLLVAFLQVSALGLLLLLAPLILSRAARAPAPLFFALGLGYMLLEMTYLARATMRVASPTLAAAAVIGGFMVGSGLGSLLVERVGRPLRRAALTAAVLAVPGWFLLPSTPLLVALVCAVVAFPMGMPFPSALSRLRLTSVPWALAVNGCASVAAAAGAPLLSSSVGIPIVVGAAALLYALVALFGRGRRAADAARAVE